jgi:PAS domain S-box-containing protein
MIQTAERVFAADPLSAGEARRFTERTLAAWGATDLLDATVLLVSEVVTNGVLHARTSIRLYLELDGGRLLVEVWDRDPSQVRLRRADREAIGGRGLAIVEAVSERWGTRHDENLKCVWFELQRSESAPVAVGGGPGGGGPGGARPGSERPRQRGHTAGRERPRQDGRRLRPVPTARPLSESRLRELRERAIRAIDRSLTISDPNQPGNPLVYVNPAFERMTGYAAEEAVGRNCRFLQGPATDPDAVARLRDALRAGRSCTVTLLNYRKDGSTFWNELTVSPVRGVHGELTHFVGVQSDATERVVDQGERERLLEAEQQARAEAEALRAVAEASRVQAEETQHRLWLLAEATTLLTTSLDVDSALERLTELVVPILADWSIVDLLDDGGRPRRVGVGHLDPGLAARLRELEQKHPQSLDEGSASASVLRGGPAVLLPEISEEWVSGWVRSPELLAAYRRAGPASSAISVPLRARGRVLGALTLLSIGAGRRFDEADLRLAEDLGRRAGLAVDNARSYERELHVAETLQRNLLPDGLPPVPGLELAVRYVAGSAGVEVGGDWYDVIPGTDGSALLVVGDVMGHDLRAAALMGRLRSAVRAYAIEDDRPAVVLHRLDRLAQRLEPGELATVVCARVAPGGTAVTYANAGHPPPLLVSSRGTRYLEGGRGVLVGVAQGAEREEVTLPLPDGGTLLLYTDGLVEDRDEQLEGGLELLASEAAARAHAGIEVVCDGLLTALGASARRDDIALLAVRRRPAIDHPRARAIPLVQPR